MIILEISSEQTLLITIIETGIVSIDLLGAILIFVILKFQNLCSQNIAMVILLVTVLTL